MIVRISKKSKQQLLFCFTRRANNETSIESNLFLSIDYEIFDTKT